MSSKTHVVLDLLKTKPVTEDTIRELANRLYLDGDLFNSEEQVDREATITWMLKFILDGRPKPFSLMDSYGSTLEHLKDPDEKREFERSLTYFAEVGELSPEFPNEAAMSIGEYSLGMNDLVKFRDWIDSVVKWHEKNHPSIPKNKRDLNADSKKPL